MRRAFGLLNEPGEVAGLLEGPDKLVGVLVQLDFDFVGELPLTVTPPDRLFPRGIVGGRVHEEHPRERGWVLPRAMRPKGRHDRPLAVLADDGAQPLKRGNLRLMHGHQIAKALPKHHAANVADEWGAPGLTVAFGHSHRPGVHVKPGREGNCRAIAVGAGRTLDPDWIKGRPGGWENELLVAYLMPAGHVAAYSVPLVSGAFLWGGKVYR
ncbi:hypothetical protein [Corallococcus sp. 4LFB]|uniref:hypothetical protein n=1 Tax=Corallococcus sp. 4LFB TaxID=3383249 RepID=UPI0039769F62